MYSFSCILVLCIDSLSPSKRLLNAVCNRDQMERSQTVQNTRFQLSRRTVFFHAAIDKCTGKQANIVMENKQSF